MNIHSLMEKFSKLPEAALGRGPKHPSMPNLALRDEIEAFLKEHPFLTKDRGYIDFLECYAGARAFRADGSLVVDIFGFTEISSHLIEADGPIIDQDGFYGFSDGIFQDRAGIDVGIGGRFDATGNRRRGVYRSRYSRPNEIDIYWYCESFLEWVEVLIDTKGHLPAKHPKYST